MNNKNFLPLDQKKRNQLENTITAEQSFIKNDFEIPDYLDYEEKDFYQF